jgi:uncharacterized protein YdhG (YjbR/CyaY superfamily)
VTEPDIPPDIAPEVHDYIAAIPADHRPVFDRLHQLILDTLDDARVTISYRMPAYVVAGGRVSLSDGPKGISLATTVAEPVAAFKARNKQFKTGKVTVLFPPGAEIPADDLRALVRAATTSSA